MKALLLTGWSFMRVLRLATGLVGVVFGLKNQDTLLGFAGLFLVVLAVFNLGCCGVSGCSISPYKETAKSKSKNKVSVDYEEVT